MSDRQAFLDQITLDPMNRETRLVCADWLEEQGEDEEADRQRQWIPARKWIEEWCEEATRAELEETRKFVDSNHEYDVESARECAEPEPDDEPFNSDEWPDDQITYEELMAMAEEALSESGPCTMWFGRKDGLMYRFQDVREEFWRNWSIVTGQPDPLQSGVDVRFSCAC